MEQPFTPRIPVLDYSQGTDLLSELITEGEDHLVNAEGAVLVLEKAPDSSEDINKIFRAFHTIKGAAAFMNLEDVKEVTHNAETMMDMARKGTMKVTPALIDVMLQSIDAVRRLLALLREQLGNGGQLKSEYFNIGPVLSVIRGVIEGGADPKQGTPAPPPSAAVPDSAPVSDFSFTPHVPVIDLSMGAEIVSEFISESEDHLANAENSILALENTPNSSEEIDRIFRAFHTIKGVASFLNFEDIKVLTHNAETLMDSVRKGQRSMEPRIVEIMLQSIDAARRLLALLKGQLAANGIQSGPYFDIAPVLAVLDALNKGKSADPASVPKKIGEILVEKEIVTAPELDTALEKQKTAAPEKKIGEILVESGAATPSQINRTLQEQQKSSAADSVIKIGAGKLDNLIDTVGELVIVGTQVIQNPHIKHSEDIKLTNDITQMEKIIRNIQDISMTLRLVPIKPVFQKMTRVIRDLSKKSGKNIAIKLSGEDTEIDKNIIDLISDPLMHMVRNSIDHGIETPEKRREAGKTPAGTVELNAFHKGGDIVIQVIDDGNGLNRDRILKKAREQGLVKEGEVLEDNRVFNLIFEPGFSTAEKVTEISGRGVGMDVVKRNVEKLRGRIEIESEQGKGSVFSIKLPLTLAIIDGVILEVGDQRYIVPVSSIVKFVRPKTGDITTPAGEKEMILVHGQLYDLIRMDRFCHVTPRYASVEESTICVVESDYGKACIAVDEILGQQQVVIKTLGEWFQDIKYLAGGAILGDGRVGLILDINNIVAHLRNA